MKINVFILILSIVFISGCEDAEFKENNRAAFKACIDSGGVPLQAWFNEEVLGDCVYKPVNK